MNDIVPNAVGTSVENSTAVIPTELPLQMSVEELATLLESLLGAGGVKEAITDVLKDALPFERDCEPKSGEEVVSTAGDISELERLLIMTLLHERVRGKIADILAGTLTIVLRNFRHVIVKGCEREIGGLKLKLEERSRLTLPDLNSST